MDEESEYGDDWDDGYDSDEGYDDGGGEGGDDWSLDPTGGDSTSSGSSSFSDAMGSATGLGGLGVPGIDMPSYVFGGGTTPSAGGFPDVNIPGAPTTSPSTGFGSTLKNILTGNQRIGSDWNFGATPALSTSDTGSSNDPQTRDRYERNSADAAAAARQGVHWPDLPFSF